METDRLLDRLQEHIDQLRQCVDALGQSPEITGLRMIYGEEATPTPEDAEEWPAGYVFAYDADTDTVIFMPPEMALSCPRCRGKGWVEYMPHPHDPPQQDECPECKGAGWVSVDEELPERVVTHDTDAEAPADIQARVDAALAEAEPTVTLHGRATLHEYQFASIRLIELSSICPEAIRVVGNAVRDDGREWQDVYVTESPADITAAARAAWGADWSCPGCVEPTVTLQNTQPYKYRSISRIEKTLNGSRIVGDWWGSQNVWVDTGRGMYVDESPADIIAACAKAGVPCPPPDSTNH